MSSLKNLNNQSIDLENWFQNSFNFWYKILLSKKQRENKNQQFESAV